MCQHPQAAAGGRCGRLEGLMNAHGIHRGMRLSEAYRLAVDTGIGCDPRGRGEVERMLKEAEDSYSKLEGFAKETFDAERLWNPYADTRLSWGDGDTEVERVMWGIDVGTGEVLLADRLREKGERIDAVVAHHPLGLARTPFPEVMWLQTDMYASAGVPITVSEGLMKGRMEEVLRGVLPANYNQAVDAARLLGLPILNIHTPADNCVQAFLTREMEEGSPRTVGDIIDILMKQPEFRMAAKHNSPPKIVVGSASARCGKVICKMNGGTSGPKEIYAELSKAGVGTVVGMHFPESHIEEARKNHVNLVVSGHMSSDSLGINLIADEWQRHGIEVLPCSGLLRHSRV